MDVEFLQKCVIGWSVRHTLWEAPCCRTRCELFGSLSSEHVQLWGRKGTLHVSWLRTPRLEWGHGNSMLWPVKQKTAQNHKSRTQLTARIKLKYIVILRRGNIFTKLAYHTHIASSTHICQIIFIFIFNSILANVIFYEYSSRFIFPHKNLFFEKITFQNLFPVFETFFDRPYST